jgi:CRISPR system Cascade subunit CasA
MNSLLVPLFRVRSTGDIGTISILTLSGVLAALMRDAIASFPALRAHQRHAWHSFLVLLAANAMHRAGLSEPPETETEWLTLLRSLTPDDADDAPWWLVSPPERAALLQPPIPAGRLAELNKVITTSDQLDMLVTAKNHDLKQALMAAAQPDDWIFALLTLQTMQGFLGAGNYGISRMNRGYGNRAALGIAPPGGSGAHVRRDVLRLLAMRDHYAREWGYAREGGLALVWLAPWDGVTALRRDALDPWYIEICRRVRLCLQDGNLFARAGGSKTARIVPIDGGVTGDPWSPIVVDKDGSSKALTVDGRGFGYRRMVDFMFRGGGVEPSPLQNPEATDEPAGLQLVARALVRGEGKTEGYHERHVPISRRMRRMFVEGATDEAAALATERVRLAGEMQDRVLKPALFTLFQNGADQINYRDKEAERKAEGFLKRFDRIVDVTFFEDLRDEIDQDDKAARARERAAWVKRLLDSGAGLLHEAEASASRSSRRRFRASVRATDRLYGAAYRNEWLKPYLAEGRRDDTSSGDID